MEIKEPEYSDGFLSTMLSVPGEIISSSGNALLSRFLPFAGQPIKIDSQAKIIEKRVEKIPLNRFTFDQNDNFFSFFKISTSKTKEIDVVALKINTYSGTLSAKIPMYFEERVSTNETIEVKFQVSKGSHRRLKGREIVIGGIQIKLTFF